MKNLSIGFVVFQIKYPTVGFVALRKILPSKCKCRNLTVFYCRTDIEMSSEPDGNVGGGTHSINVK